MQSKFFVSESLKIEVDRNCQWFRF